MGVNCIDRPTGPVREREIHATKRGEGDSFIIKILLFTGLYEYQKPPQRIANNKSLFSWLMKLDLRGLLAQCNGIYAA